MRICFGPRPVGYFVLLYGGSRRIHAGLENERKKAERIPLSVALLGMASVEPEGSAVIRTLEPNLLRCSLLLCFVWQHRGPLEHGQKRRRWSDSRAFGGLGGSCSNI